MYANINLNPLFTWNFTRISLIFAFYNWHNLFKVFDDSNSCTFTLCRVCWLKWFDKCPFTLRLTSIYCAMEIHSATLLNGMHIMWYKQVVDEKFSIKFVIYLVWKGIRSCWVTARGLHDLWQAVMISWSLEWDLNCSFGFVGDWDVRYRINVCEFVSACVKLLRPSG